MSWHFRKESAVKCAEVFLSPEIAHDAVTLQSQIRP